MNRAENSYLYLPRLRPGPFFFFFLSFFSFFFPDFNRPQLTNRARERWQRLF